MEKVKAEKLRDTRQPIVETGEDGESDDEEMDAPGEDDEELEGSGDENEGSARGHKRARVSDDGSARPSQPGRLDVKTLPRDADG